MATKKQRQIVIFASLAGAAFILFSGRKANAAEVAPIKESLQGGSSGQNTFTSLLADSLAQVDDIGDNNTLAIPVDTTVKNLDPQGPGAGSGPKIQPAPTQPTAPPIIRIAPRNRVGGTRRSGGALRLR